VGGIRTRAPEGDFANLSVFIDCGVISGFRIRRKRVMAVQVMMRVMMGRRLRIETARAAPSPACLGRQRANRR
jgi:hypothetical protein